MARPSLRSWLRNTVSDLTGIGGEEHVLYIGADALIALRRQPGSAGLVEVFHLDDESTLPFATDAPAISPVPDSTIMTSSSRWV